MKNLLITISAVLIFSCGKDKEEVREKEKPAKDVSGNLNVSILIDLSDRISPTLYSNPTMEYFMRDVGYINSISGAFMDHVNSKKIKQMDDRIQVYFDPAPMNPEINSISGKLKYDLQKDNVSNELLSELKENYGTLPLELYKLAIKDNNYVGSDTWKFFQDKIGDYAIDKQHRNILVLLTDGYIYYDNSLMEEKNRTSYLTPKLIRENGLNGADWNEKMVKNDYGFITAGKDLSDLEILVLGVNPNSKNPYEQKVIVAYWTKWFEEMKVKRYEIKSADLPADMDKIIKGFIDAK